MSLGWLGGRITLGLSLKRRAQRPGRLTTGSPGSGAATPLAWGSQQGGDRKGRGRPLGGTHLYFSFLEQSEQKQSRVAVGVGMGPTSHTTAIKGFRSMALRKHENTRNKDTSVP